MNKVLHFTQNSDRVVYVTSDTHWNHNPKWPVPLWQSRGYKSLEESNVHIIQSINERVRENDILFHLGDLTLNCTEEQFERFIGSIVCKNIYTLWGNHNSPAWKIYQREVAGVYYTKGYTGYSIDPLTNKQIMGGPNNAFVELLAANVEIYPLRYKNIIFIGNYAEVVVDGLYFVLCHYPIYVFNHMKDGAIQLCGHSHYNLPLSQADDPSSKILDVGWDGWAKPLAVKEIVDIVANKKVMVVDHHGREE